MLKLLQSFFWCCADLTRGAKILAGISILKTKPNIIDKDPRPKHIRCSSVVNGTVLSEWPPN
jgi:hypothetical protein